MKSTTALISAYKFLTIFPTIFWKMLIAEFPKNSPGILKTHSHCLGISFEFFYPIHLILMGERRGKWNSHNFLKVVPLFWLDVILA